MKRTIRLTESELRQMISESVRRVMLNESDVEKQIEELERQIEEHKYEIERLEREINNIMQESGEFEDTAPHAPWRYGI